MKKLTLLIASLGIFLSQQSFAACTTAPSPNDYLALDAATALDQPNLVDKLFSTYCYDANRIDYTALGKEAPIFFTTSPAMLSYYIRKSRDITDFKTQHTQLDILSKLLVQPYTTYQEATPSEKRDIINFLKKYSPDANLTWFNSDFQTIENPKDRYKKPSVLANNQAMIKVLLPIYVKKLTFPQDFKGNDALTYAVLTNNYEVVQTLSNDNTIFYRRNKDGFSLFHLAFAKHKFAGDPKVGEENLKRINDIIVKNYKSNYAQYLNIQNVPFYNFIEIMKDNNPDLYIKLKNKVKFDNNENFVSKNASNKEYYDKAMDYFSALDY